MTEVKKGFYVWKDNLMEELFAISVEEMNKFPKMKEQLEKEKNILHIIEADSEKEAFDLFKEKFYVKPESTQQEEEILPVKETSSQTKRILH